MDSLARTLTAIVTIAKAVANAVNEGRSKQDGFIDAFNLLNQCENLYECPVCDCYYPASLYVDGRCEPCREEDNHMYHPCEHRAKGMHVCPVSDGVHPVCANEETFPYTYFDLPSGSDYDSV